MQARKSNRTLGCISGQFINEALWHFRPMQPRVDVMHNVVPIVEGEQVFDVVDAIVGKCIIQSGTVRVHENVLGPIAKHKHQRDEEKWDDQCEGSCCGIDAEEEDNCRHPQHFTCKCLQSHTVPFLPDSIEQQFKVDCECESGPVVKEMEEIVTLIWHCGAQIFRKHVVLKMMHHDMMKSVTPRWDAEERTQDVWGITMKKCEFTSRNEHPSVLRIMQHEDEPLSVEKVHYEQMQYAQPCRIVPAGCWHEKLKRSRRQHHTGDVKHQIQHNGVAFIRKVGIYDIMDKLWQCNVVFAAR